MNSIVEYQPYPKAMKNVRIPLDSGGELTYSMFEVDILDPVTSAVIGQESKMKLIYNDGVADVDLFELNEEDTVNYFYLIKDIVSTVRK